MPADTWNPAQYEKFKRERALPFYDLMALIEIFPGGKAADLGCGTGELTRLFHEASQAGETVGIDNSPAMLEKARQFTDRGLRFERGDMGSFAPKSEFDLIISNAAIQWTSDHPALLARLKDALKPGGVLAIQVPANHLTPASLASAEVAGEEPFRTALSGWHLAFPVLKPEEYMTALYDLGFLQRQVMLKVYEHELSSRDDVVEWYRGSLLTDYQKKLSPELFGQYMDRYAERVRQILPDRRPYLFTFNRILMRGKKPG